MTRRDSRTYQTAARAHARVMAAQREMEPEKEPMHRYVFPIPQPAPDNPPADDVSAAATQALEQLAYQSQLLVDLLGAVNSLTAALLCTKET